MDDLIWPVTWPRVTQWFGGNPAYYSRFRYGGVPLLGHNGIDLGCGVGTPVLAMDAGTVMEVGYEAGGFGNYVKLKHGWGESLYAHLERVGFDLGGSLLRTRPGDHVRQGQEIARSGNTGGSTGPHLHFAIRINPYSRVDGWGGFSDPAPHLDLGALVQTRGVVDEAAGEGMGAMVEEGTI